MYQTRSKSTSFQDTPARDVPAHRADARSALDGEEKSKETSGSGHTTTGNVSGKGTNPIDAIGAAVGKLFGTPSSPSTPSAFNDKDVEAPVAPMDKKAGKKSVSDADQEPEPLLG